MTNPKIGDKFVTTDKNIGSNELVLVKYNTPKIVGDKEFLNEVMKISELPENATEIQGTIGLRAFEI